MIMLLKIKIKLWQEDLPYELDKENKRSTISLNFIEKIITNY